MRRKLSALVLASVILVQPKSWDRPLLAAEETKSIPAGTAFKEIPQWASLELAAFVETEKALSTFFKCFVKTGGATVVSEKVHHGNIDDIIEGFFKWDKFILLAGSDKLRKQYIDVWKYHWQLGLRKEFFKDGFYIKGYDAEHAGELFPMLWACLELSPSDPALIKVNKAFSDLMLQPAWFHPQRHLFRYTWIRSRPIDEPWREKWLVPRSGESAINPVYSGGVFLAYLVSKENKYRKWVLDYAGAWNQAAKVNQGVFPFHIDTASGKFGPDGDGRWWKGGKGDESFDFEKYGMVVASRGWRSLPAAAVLLDQGNSAHAAGLVSTVKAIFANSVDGLPAVGYAKSKGGWYRDKKTWPHHIPALLSKAYELSWDPALLKLIQNYPIDNPKVRWLEKNIATWCLLTYSGKVKPDHLRARFKQLIGSARRRSKKAQDLKDPESGDDITAVSMTFFGGFDYVDGSSWAGHNGRNGGPNLGPVGYFAKSGRRGLPPGIAAAVVSSKKTEVELLICNSNPRKTALVVTGGYYGQHRIETLILNPDALHKVISAKVVLDLAPLSVARIVLKLSRHTENPSLLPVAVESK
jgi:hypothetical protein